MHYSLGEDEGDHVSQMHAIATWPSTRVQEERFALLITIQNGIEVSARKYGISGKITRYPKHDAPMGEKHPATEENVWLVPRETLKALQQRSVDPPGTELLYEFVIVDRELLPVARDGTLHVPGGYYLLVRGRGVCGLDRGRNCGVAARLLSPGTGDEEFNSPNGDGSRQFVGKVVESRCFF